MHQDLVEVLRGDAIHDPCNAFSLQGMNECHEFPNHYDWKGLVACQEPYALELTKNQNASSITHPLLIPPCLCPLHVINLFIFMSSPTLSPSNPLSLPPDDASCSQES